jgi:hypothetical protein
MYGVMRNIHLLLGLLCCPFLLMYGVSAAQMSHPKWFDIRPAVSERTLALAPAQSDARALAATLMREQGLRGDLTQVRVSPGRLEFSLVRPGLAHMVRYDAATGSAVVRQSRSGLLGTLNRIHHVGGLAHDDWLVSAWGGVLGLVAAALLALGASGIYMWFRIHTERVAGGLLLGVSLAFSLVLIVLIRLG